MVSQILIVMIAAIAVTIFAERRNIQAPLLLAFVGLLASLIPGLERLELEPEIILTVVLPPLLFSAATEFSVVSFLKRFGSIFNLGVLLVAVTTGVVGAIAAQTIPGMTIGVALVLAAVISPPDAVTAVAVGRQLGLPTRMMTVLKGESLINDAAALTLFTFAAASVTGRSLMIDNLLLFLLYSAVAGVAVGVVLGLIVHRTKLRLKSASLSTVLSVLVPFTAYILAEEIGASGVLAVVSAGFVLGHNSSGTSYQARIQERQFWKTADALLEAFVFAYIGLQFRWTLTEATAEGADLGMLMVVSLIILVAVIVVRLVWVLFAGLLSDWRARAHARRAELLEASGLPRPGVRAPMPPFHWRENVVIGWTGMRGVVTLAAAAGIPLVTVAGEAFPHREMIQVIAFVVTIGTLMVQGLTLPWLIRVLRIGDPNEESFHNAQLAIAEGVVRQATIDTVTAFRDRQSDESARNLAEMMLRRASMEQSEHFEGAGPTLQDLAREIQAGRRAAVIRARDERRLDDEVMREVLEEMDLEQAVTENWRPGRGRQTE